MDQLILAIFIVAPNYFLTIVCVKPSVVHGGVEMECIGPVLLTTHLLCLAKLS